MCVIACNNYIPLYIHFVANFSTKTTSTLNEINQLSENCSVDTIPSSLNWLE